MSKLSSWSSNIVNHFWYSCRTCNGDVKKLKVNITINKIIVLQFMQEKWLGHCITCRMNMSGFLAGINIMPL